MDRDGKDMVIPNPKVLGAGYILAAHQLEESPVFSDPTITRMLNVGVDILTDPASAVGYHSDVRLQVALTHRFAEDVVSAATKSGTAQLVVLDAGLDTTCYRRPYPGMALFEIDELPTQMWKRQLLACAGITPPPSLRYLHFDGRHRLADTEFEHSGYDFGLPTLIVWLDKAALLTRESMADTLLWLGRHQGPIELVFNYIQPPDTVQAATRQNIGPLLEPLAQAGLELMSFFTPPQLTRALRDHDFDRIDDLSWFDLLRHYRVATADTHDPLGIRVIHAHKPRR